LKRSDEQLLVVQTLETLRRDHGDREFGYRAQGLLGHVLIRLGGTINDMKAQGHPDIIVGLWGKTVVFEVEVASATHSSHVIKPEDVAAIHPPSGNTIGYLAILDCGPPAVWILVNHQRLEKRAGSSVSLVTLRAISDKTLSEECTKEFSKLILENKVNLPNLTFHVLRARALRGDSL